MLKALCLFLIAFFHLTTVNQKAADLSCKDVLTKMVKATKSIERLKFTLKSTERSKAGVNNFESTNKLNVKPRKVYVSVKGGAEVLWVQGTNNEKALVNPHAFPYVNLNLDPMESLMRKDQHHTIHEVGFDYFGDIIDYGIKKVGVKFDEYFKLEGEEKHNGRPCYKVVINNTNYDKTTYTASANETITNIARKLKISEYRILELNPSIDGYNFILKKGQVIKVTNWYAKEVVMYIDKFYFLPIGVKLSDDKGLFEQYEYQSLQLNPKFESNEFSQDYKDYQFK